MRRVALYLLALLVTAGAVAGGVRLAADNSNALDRFKGDDARTAPRPTTPPGPAPAEGQAFVTGTVERLVAEGAQGAPVATPFTLTAVERGRGRVAIENALVDGRRTSIVWGGGTPLPVTGGGGAIDLGGSRIDVDPGGATWRVDGAPRSLKPGRYRAGAPVAVGVGGLATPRDAVDFTADAMTQVQATGGVIVRLPPARLEVTGPGKVTATGQLLVRDPRTRLPAQSVQFGEGPYKVALTPSGGRLELDAVLQGPLTRT